MEISVTDNLQAVLASMNRYVDDVVVKAIPRALNRTTEMAITNSSRSIRSEGYNFTASEIKNAMRFVQASGSSRYTTIKVKRKTKSLMSFSPTQTKAGVTVKVFGQRKLIKGAFIAQRKNGVSGVFVEDKAAGKIVLRFAKQYKRGSRGGWHDYPARKLYGPSVGGVYGNDRMQALVSAFVNETFAKRLAHEIKYLSR